MSVSANRAGFISFKPGFPVLSRGPRTWIDPQDTELSHPLEVFLDSLSPGTISPSREGLLGAVTGSDFADGKLPCLE